MKKFELEDGERILLVSRGKVILFYDDGIPKTIILEEKLEEAKNPSIEILKAVGRGIKWTAQTTGRGLKAMVSDTKKVKKK